ncbi:MAG: hypothetical protein R6W06_11375 [Prochlorococcaceae cyanobacterium]
MLAGVQQKIGDLQRQLFPQRILLDLEDGGLRGLSLSGGRTSRVGGLWQASFPEGLCRQGRPQQITALGDFIGDLVLEQGLVAPRLSACLPASACAWRVPRTLRRQTCVPASMVTVHGKHQPLAWNIGSVHK